MTIQSQLPPQISAYLEATRFTQTTKFFLSERVPAVGAAYYGTLTDIVRKIAAAHSIDVKVEIVYSDSMRSEAVMFGDQHFIIYDRYAGQVTNMMNRLFLYGSSRNTKLTYFHKLVSQILSRYGFYEEAAFAARQYQHYRDEMDHQRRQADDGSGKHLLYTHIQETYVFLHEVTHILLKHVSELRQDLRKDVVSWIEEYAARSGAYPEQPYVPQHCTEILAREDLIEEFCCDRFAITLLPTVISAQLNAVGKNDAESKSATDEHIRAVLLCLLNLRTVQLLEAQCSAETQYDFNERVEGPTILDTMYATFYSARAHHGKECCYQFFDIEASRYEPLHAGVTQLMSDHSDEILDPALGTLSTVMYDRSIRTTMAADFELIRTALAKQNSEDSRLITSILHYVRPHEAGE